MTILNGTLRYFQVHFGKSKCFSRHLKWHHLIHHLKGHTSIIPIQKILTVIMMSHNYIFKYLNQEIVSPPEATKLPKQLPVELWVPASTDDTFSVYYVEIVSKTKII